MASPFTLSHLPIAARRSSEGAGISPLGVGPTEFAEAPSVVHRHARFPILAGETGRGDVLFGRLDVAVITAAKAVVHDDGWISGHHRCVDAVRA
jgi:hypothetical protein